MGKDARKVFSGIASPGEIDAKAGRLEAKAKAAGVTLPGDAQAQAAPSNMPAAGDTKTIDAIKAAQKRNRKPAPDTILGNASGSLGG